MCACEIYHQMTLSEKGGSIVHPQSCKWQHFIHWNLNFCLLSHDLRNLHLLLFWKSFDLTFKFTSIHEKFKMQIPMRTSSNFFYEIQTYISPDKNIHIYIVVSIFDRCVSPPIACFFCCFHTKTDYHRQIYRDPLHFTLYNGTFPVCP